MGKVYRAEQAPLGRVCALKVLNPNYAGDQDPEFHKRFFLEASIASKLTHPNTVTIFDYGRTDDDVYYMAMEYLEGHTLHRAIREAGHFPEERAAHVARQICRALREAHSLGVIHRDLKPANIFLVEHGDETDFVKILDFGLVKNVSDTKTEDLTQTGLFMGSPKYMAPEQIRGDRVDARTDIYALGIILYEMIAGKVPFDRPNSVNILMAHVNEEAPPLRQMNPNTQVSPAFEEIIARCMAKDPEPALPVDGRGARGPQARGRRRALADVQRHGDRRVQRARRLRSRPRECSATAGAVPPSTCRSPSLSGSGSIMAPTFPAVDVAVTPAPSRPAAEQRVQGDPRHGGRRCARHRGHRRLRRAATRAAPRWRRTPGRADASRPRRRPRRRRLATEAAPRRSRSSRFESTRIPTARASRKTASSSVGARRATSSTRARTLIPRASTS